ADEYRRSVQARTQARRRLQNLQAMRNMPEFLDPVRKADLDNAIEIAKKDREESLKASQEARGKMKLAQAAGQQARAQEMRKAAAGRLATPDPSYRVKPEVPHFEEILNPAIDSLHRAFFRTVKDAMLAQGLLLDENNYVTPQAVNWIRQNKISIDHLIPMIEQQGMTVSSFLKYLIHTESTAGRAQQAASELRVAN